MKKIRLISIFFLIFGTVLSGVLPAGAFPGLPSTFTGTVTLNGAPVAAGTIVSAWINGYECVSSTVVSIPPNMAYLLKVRAKDLEDANSLHCGVDGDTVVFHIGSIVANETGTFTSGGSVVTLNLTGSSLPGAFNKTSPGNAATGVAFNPTLSWGASTGAASYEYCYATTTGCSSWTSVGTATSVGLTGLSSNTKYYWQVRAVNAGGNTQANAGSYWSFTTIASAPGAFNKTSPGNAAAGVVLNPTLAWGASAGAASYEYCYATTSGCSSWTSVGAATSVGLSGLSYAETYYWQVRARNGSGTKLANNGTYWSFTTRAESTPFTIFLPLLLR